MYNLQFQAKTSKPKMTTDDRKVILELSEHDAMRLLFLIESELNEGDKVWQNYWARLARQVKQGLEQAGFDYRQEPSCSTDTDNC